MENLNEHGRDFYGFYPGVPVFLWAAANVSGIVPDHTAALSLKRRYSLKYESLPDDLKDYGRFCAW